ncbi:hypothetical protein BDR06DRAFT_973945 [Suillus hirtellus]|nr:hypothetical protein BDR06DRAFT_973945 [Suillus hirtellus]
MPIFTWLAGISLWTLLILVSIMDMRVPHGLAVTGAGTIDCMQHNFKRPCLVGDLQKGERQLSSSDVSALNISYNITCQWSKHLWMQMSTFPHWYHIKHNQKAITFLIPKFHLLAHVAKYGEAPECVWADMNSIAMSTCEMGPGLRHNTLDDHFNDWNWKKICAMAKWRNDINAWEVDHLQPNPFESRAMATMTQAAVCLALSMAEAAEIEHGINMHRLDFDAKMIGQHATDVQKGKILHVSCLWSPDDIATETKVSSISFFLPSFLPQQVLCDDCLLKYEWDLCEAQYSTPRDALLNLAARLVKNNGWERSLKLLNKKTDAVPLKHDNGHTTLGSNSNELGLQDSLCVEWYKS